MTPSDLRKLIDQELGEETLLEGMAFYSGLDALSRRGRFYVLGYNPANKGGNYTRLQDEKFKPSNWSAYIDQCWHLNDDANCGCTSWGGHKPFQVRARRLIQTLHGSDDPSLARLTFATNAIFVASADPGGLGNASRRQALWEKHWRIHRKLLSIIQPDFIVALGYGPTSSYSLLKNVFGGGAGQATGLPPLKWSDLKYGFDHGGEGEWLGNGIVLKR
jgi:hypothetical protein